MPDADPAELLNRTNALAHPDVLAAALREAAGCLRQQAVACAMGSAMGGHPNPEYFYRRTAEIMNAAADRIAAAPPSKPEPAFFPVGGAPTSPSLPSLPPPVPGAWAEGAAAPTPPDKRRK